MKMRFLPVLAACLAALCQAGEKPAIPLARLAPLPEDEAAARKNITEIEIAASGAVVGKWTSDLAAAKRLAREKNLPILLNFTGTEWCGWCKMMNSNVFSKQEWQAYAAKNLVLVALDYPMNPEGAGAEKVALLKKYHVNGFPMFHVLPPTGESEFTLIENRGQTPAAFIAAIEGVVKIQRALANLSAKDKAAWEANRQALAANSNMAARVINEAKKQLEFLEEERAGLEAKKKAMLEKFINPATNAAAEN